MNARRLALGLAAGLVVLLLLVPVGRWERNRHADEENRGIRGVLALVGPLDSRALAGFRRFTSFDCLVYRQGPNPLALEVCVDHEGRVIEGIDRRSGQPRIWSLREDPSRAAVRVDRAFVVRLLRGMGARFP